MADAVRARTARPVRWGVPDAAGGLMLALVLVIFLMPLTLMWPPEASLPASYLAVWIPLGGAVLLASFVRGRRSLTLDFGLRFTWLDLLWGLSIGLLARAVASLIELGLTGYTLVPQASFGPVERDFWWLFALILAPVLIAPVVEELFFRGLLLRSLTRKTSVAAAVGITALIFALVHLIDAPTPLAGLSTGLSLVIFGAAVGVLSVTTGRLGGALIAHVTFNGSLVLAVSL